MSDDMEIMMEFRIEWEKIQKKLYVSSENKEALELALLDAVKREIVRMLEKIDKRFAGGLNYANGYLHYDVIHGFINEYSTSPYYCEGMRKAIGRMNNVKDDAEADITFFHHVVLNDKCPWCPEGENCIGGKE